MNSKHEVSNREWEAILYVLRDDSLDCEAFEAKLADDPLVAQAVSEAVALVHALKQTPPSQPDTAHSPPSSLHLPPQPIRYSYAVAGLVVAVSIAVVFLATTIGFQGISLKPSPNSMAEVANAWTDWLATNNYPAHDNSLHGQPEIGLENDSFDTGVELKSAAADTLLGPAKDGLPENDMPDWMLIAVLETPSSTVEALQ